MEIKTPITELFGIKKPIFLAGMNVAAGPELAAAVTNEGGLGVIGGLGYTPDMLREQCQKIKDDLINKSDPWGVDLLLPQIGGSARKTNKDYTDGSLDELINIIIEEGASLFVSAIGVPPLSICEKLHNAGIPIMNMIGAPKHVQKAIDAGVDIICAQGGEGGGHTGEIPTSILIPKCYDAIKEINAKSPLHGGPIHLVAAGGIFDGRGLAMALSLGADAVWVGTRFVASEEANATSRHQKGVLECDYDDTIKTLIYTGRPLRVKKNDYILDWEENRQEEIKELTNKGILPSTHQTNKEKEEGTELSFSEQMDRINPMLMGQDAAAIDSIKPAKEIMDEMVEDCISILQKIYEDRLISKL